MNFFETYKSENPDFGTDTFRCASETVTKLLHTATSSDHPGMLLGKVQSGKTRTFISILADAFDSGFDIAIVLSKNSKALIEQTVKRLDSEFKTFTDSGECEVYDVMNAPDSFNRFELQAKHIFIAKKQTHNLQRLIDLFHTKCPEMANMRTLIIDDEADNASVGYANKKGSIESTKIATQISELRGVIKNVSFLQVTATPYSLYLQPADIDVANVQTFHPTRPAFTSLVPVPAEYVGGDTYFGEKAATDAPSVERYIHHVVDHNELEILKGSDRRRFKIEEALTSPAIQSYRHAITTFITGGCIQILNAENEGQNTRNLRYSFLVHSEQAKDAHRHQESITTELSEQLAKAATAGGSIIEGLIRESYDDLSRSITLYSQPLPSFDDVLAKVIEALTGGYITIIKVNSDEQVASMLDKTGQLKLRTPLNIFIGGQVLDRGVTLANLTGFYYGRRPNRYQQDTVLQHSRMYGYRRKDLSVTRFYTSNAIRQTMFEMEEFDSSLRNSIEQSQKHGGDDSVQFIRRASNGTIVPCSPNKILIATTQTLRPFRRILPVGFQSGYKTTISATINEIDHIIAQNGGFGANEPVSIPLATALELLTKIESTLNWDKTEDAPAFDWSAIRASLTHLAAQNAAGTGTVLLWAADNRKIARFRTQQGEQGFSDSPDTPKTEGAMARRCAIDEPILFLLRQNGKKDKGWRDTAFYWPVIQAQANTPTSIYTAETTDN